MNKPFNPSQTAVKAEEIKEALPSRGEIQQALNKIPRETSDREEGMTRRRMIGGGTKLGVDCTKLIERGYTPYWRNDQDGRVQECLANGYEFVNPDEIEETSLQIGAAEMTVDKVSRVVGFNDKGEPIRAYLMKIRSEWKEENDAFYQRRCDKIDKAIKAGKTVPVEEGYVPNDGITYSRSR